MLLTTRRSAHYDDRSPSVGRVAFFSLLNAWVGGLTLVFQVLLFSRTTASRHIGPTGTLCAEPLVLAIGLLAALSFPGSLLAVAYLDCYRKVVHYAFSKPTKEAIYASLPEDVQYRAKPVHALALEPAV